MKLSANTCQQTRFACYFELTELAPESTKTREMLESHV